MINSVHNSTNSEVQFKSSRLSRRELIKHHIEELDLDRTKKLFLEGGIGIYGEKIQRRIVRRLDQEQFEELKSIIKNSINERTLYCYIEPCKMNKIRLKAEFESGYFINNFKQSFKQIPVFESYFGFIKRISKQFNKYKAQLIKAGSKGWEGANKR